LIEGKPYMSCEHSGVSIKLVLALLIVVSLTPCSINNVLAETTPGSVKIPGGKVDQKYCYVKLDDYVYNEAIEKLAEAALHRSDAAVGCLTYPYRGGDYLNNTTNNEVHAGVDLRAPLGTPVFAIEAGNVVHINLCANGDTPKTQPLCHSADGKEHSTLVIESALGNRKILYLHMSEIARKEGNSIAAGAPIGKSGAVGADHEHLHIEVWPKTSPHYLDRDSAISGSACPPKNICTDADIQKYTSDPRDLFSVVASALSTDTGARSASTLAATCKEIVVSPGLSGAEAALALGPAKEFDRAQQIAALVNGRSLRVPLCAEEVAQMLEGTTDANRSGSIGALVNVIKFDLSGKEAGTILGSAKQCGELARATAIAHLARAKKLKLPLQGDEWALVLDGTSGGNRSAAMNSILAK
jgi:hypothetical protein